MQSLRTSLCNRALWPSPAVRLHWPESQTVDLLALDEALSQLEELYLAKCAITDAGLSHIAGLSRLQAINIYGTQITSVGLEHLMGLEDLRLLMITDLKLKPAVVDRLKAKLPRLTVTDFTPT